jgi:hypothetical protein
VKELIEPIAFERTRLTATVRPPLPAGAAAPALATAIRVFECYPVNERVAVISEADEVRLFRDEVQRPLH